MPYIQKIKIPGQNEAYPIKAEAVVDDINLGGEPTAVTPPPDDISDRIATTEYIDEVFFKPVIKNGILYVDEPKDEGPDYLCFTAEETESTITLAKNGNPSALSLETSTDKEIWIPFTAGTTTVTLDNIGDKVYFRGDNSKGIGTSSKNYYKFVMTGTISASGNIMSLVDSTVESLTIPSSYCYYGMFTGCTSLTTTPLLPATTLKDDCYEVMFQGCTSLITAPELPATTLASFCYSGMFKNCTSLIAAPVLPATTLAGTCYSGMFENCTALATAPELPATELTFMCYYQLFKGCTSLTTAPELPATELANNCYSEMFNGCIKLNYIEVAFTVWNPSTQTKYWVSGVASTGNFVCPDSLPIEFGASNIPSGWTIETK